MELDFQVHSPANFDLKEVRKTVRPPKKRKAPRPPKKKEEPAEPPPKKKRGRPTRPPARFFQPRKVPTKLRRDRPVQTRLTTDIWETVFSFCTLEKLLKVRLICSTFHAILQSDYVWKQARLNQFGPQHPDPPPGMNEFQYADLLAGVGCQSAGCTEVRTRRTYWAFRRRWCEKCCSRNVIRGRLANQITEDFDLVSECIPKASYDSWGHYGSVGTEARIEEWFPFPQGAIAVFAKHDVADFLQRRTKFLESKSGDDSAEAKDIEPDLKKWAQQQKEENAMLMSRLQRIENWMVDYRERRTHHREDLREQRIELFTARAAELGDPIDSAVLRECPSFNRSVQIPKAPTEKSWQILAEKLTEERKTPEARRSKINRQRALDDLRSTLRDKFPVSMEVRRRMETPEQALVLRLADDVIARYFDETQRKFAPHEVVRTVLHETYRAFQNLGEDQLSTLPTPGYKLILDDARYVYQRRLEPLFDGLYPGHLHQVTKWKCPARTCRKATFHYNFVELMTHLVRMHPYEKGFGHIGLFHLHRQTDEQFWYCLEWPRHLPMLALHENFTVDWDIDAEEDPVIATTSQDSRSMVPLGDLTQSIGPSRGIGPQSGLEPHDSYGERGLARWVGSSAERVEIHYSHMSVAEYWDVVIELIRWWTHVAGRAASKTDLMDLRRTMGHPVWQASEASKAKAQCRLCGRICVATTPAPEGLPLSNATSFHPHPASLRYPFSRTSPSPGIDSADSDDSFLGSSRGTLPIIFGRDDVQMTRKRDDDFFALIEHYMTDHQGDYFWTRDRLVRNLEERSLVAFFNSLVGLDGVNVRRERPIDIDFWDSDY